jgi:hypothetical protein
MLAYLVIITGTKRDKTLLRDRARFSYDLMFSRFAPFMPKNVACQPRAMTLALPQGGWR